MARTLLDMAKSLERRAARFSGAANERKKRAALAALRYLVNITPVDTSKALSNWQLNLDRPAEVGRGAFYPGEHGSTRRMSAEAAYLWGEDTVQDVKPGQPIWLSNLAPYILELDRGSSKQHPGGFVAQALIIIGNTQ